MPLPTIAEISSAEFRILAKVEGDQVLIQDPVTGSTHTLDKDAFSETWSGKLILVSRRTSIPAALEEFNIGWFLDALKKYKGLFGEVLLASFFIQLFALITPWFLQVVINKVVTALILWIGGILNVATKPALIPIVPHSRQ